MASLKEVKTRITSVQSTRKITSAMKMVASSKLHKAQQAIENMRPYETQLAHIMSAFVNGAQGDVSSPFSAQRSVQNVVLIAVSSNGSLCGGFNANLIKKVRETIKEYQAQHVDIRVIPFGRKVADALSKEGFSFDSDHSSMLEHPSYEDAAVIVRNLMKEFVEGTVDRVELIYHHFKSKLWSARPYFPWSIPRRTRMPRQATTLTISSSLRWKKSWRSWYPRRYV